MRRKGAGSVAVCGGHYYAYGGAVVYQAFYRKWRPKTFADVVGQEHITSTLRRQVAEGRLSHAYLFTGTRGTGKTTCAKILAKAVNCENPRDGDPCNACPACLGIESGAFLDVTELDAASNNGVDNVRALRDEAVYSPAQVKKRVYIIDEVHMLSTAAFNALLKILEEPPEHLMFILATTELHKVLPTILSRCQRFAFRRILPRDIEARLDYVAKAEGIDLRPDGAELLARLSDGAMRDALSLLDQCSAAGGSIGAAEVLDILGLAGNVQTAQLLGFVLRRDAKAALLLLHQLYSGGKDVGAVIGELSTLARDLLISAAAPEGGAALLSGGYDAKTLAALQKQASGARLVQICTVLQETAASLPMSVNARTDAELCLLRLCDESLSGDVTALCARIARLEEQIAAGAAYRQSPAAQSVPEDDFTEDEAPPPYGEPVAPEPEPVPEPEPEPEPAPVEDGDIFERLMESYKNRLPTPVRGFLSTAKGRLAGGVMTVYCANDNGKHMLEKMNAAAVIAEVTGNAVGQAVTARLVVGEPEGAAHDKMRDLLQIGGKFDGFTVK